MAVIAKTQLIGGNFQDAEGNVLAFGYLEMELSQDATVTGVGNVAAGITIRIALDSNGSIVQTPAQYVWGNDNLLPVNTFYRVTGYTVLGQPAWGPNNQQVIGASPFDVGTWIPNQVISWVPSVQGLLLETNGTSNQSQALLDFVDTASVTWANTGGQVKATAAGGVSFENNSTPNTSQAVLNFEDTASVTWANPSGGILKATVAGGGTATADYMFGAGGFERAVNPNPSQGAAGNDSANRVYCHRFMTPYNLSFTKISFTAACNLGGGGFINVGLYNSTGALLFSTGAIAIGNFTNLDVDQALSPTWTAVPGTYFLAYATSDVNNTNMWGWSLAGSIINSGNSSRNLLNRDGVVNFGYAANAATSGAAAMPSTLGALTASTGANNVGTPAILFQK